MSTDNLNFGEVCAGVLTTLPVLQSVLRCAVIIAIGVPEFSAVIVNQLLCAVQSIVVAVFFAKDPVIYLIISVVSVIITKH